jgi:phosphate transport system substrate-binding protein
MVLLSMFAPFYAVSTDLDGISYSVYYYEENMAPAEERVKLLAVDGVMPDAGSIASNEYPYVTEVYAVLRSSLPRHSLARQLRNWLLLPDGQALIAKSGYVPRFR